MPPCSMVPEYAEFGVFGAIKTIFTRLYQFCLLVSDTAYMPYSYAQGGRGGGVEIGGGSFKNHI